MIEYRKFEHEGVKWEGPGMYVRVPLESGAEFLIETDIGAGPTPCCRLVLPHRARWAVSRPRHSVSTGETPGNHRKTGRNHRVIPDVPASASRNDQNRSLRVGKDALGSGQVQTSGGRRGQADGPTRQDFGEAPQSIHRDARGRAVPDPRRSTSGARPDGSRSRTQRRHPCNALSSAD